MECFLFDLAISAKNCRMKRIAPKDDVAGWTRFHSKTMILRIVIYEVAIDLLADLEGLVIGKAEVFECCPLSRDRSLEKLW